jgi:peptidoglycan/LPS O-acetylase OafA/YrhL
VTSVAPARLAYRPELDAIRGVAILLVLLQHYVFIGALDRRMGVPGMAGVTLFFVLSGYLITSLLIAEHSKTGRVNLRHFYERRVRRLAPALAVLVVVAALLGWPGSPLLAALYLGNWTDRLHVDMGFLTHTWTLGIEEQFYLVWPLVFMALVWWPKALVGVLVLAVAASIAFRAEIGNVMRADALGAGCLLALYGKRLPRWAGVLGWGSLLALCAVLGEPPDWIWTAAAVSSTLIVGAGRVPLLRSLVWLGGISYALYLWNYPIARIGNPVAIMLGPAGIVAWMFVGMGISLLVAWISTRWIEAPFRSRNLDHARDDDLIARRPSPRHRRADAVDGAVMAYRTSDGG